MADQGVADVEGVEVGNPQQFGQVGKTKAMAGIHLEVQATRLLGGFFQAEEFGLAGAGPGIRKFSGVQFDDRNPQGAGRRDLARIRIDEKADEDARLPQFLDDRLQRLFLPGGVEPPPPW